MANHPFRVCTNPQYAERGWETSKDDERTVVAERVDERGNEGRRREAAHGLTPRRGAMRMATGIWTSSSAT